MQQAQHFPMPRAGIYAITDDKLLTAQTMTAAVTAALEAGIVLLQYRGKSGSKQERLATAVALQALCARYAVPLIINDDVELCLAAGASGVHIGREDGSLSAARARLGTQAIIGVTCHNSLDLARTAERAGANYVAFGRFFPSHTKPEASPAELSLLADAKRVLSVPVVAIGGINAENGAAARRAGADLLAVVHAIFGSHDVGASTRELVALYKN